MTKFKVGDKVKIAKTSQFYRYNTDNNPRNVIGTITNNKNYTSLPLYVKWANGKTNGYDLKDLELARKDWDTLEIGDTIQPLNHLSPKYTVYGVLDDIVFYGKTNDIVFTTTKSHLKSKAWTIEDTTEPEQTELTLEDIAKKFNVPVEQLRIKD